MPEPRTPSDEPIDLDIPTSWPGPTRRWGEEQAERLAGSTEFLADLAISLEQEDEFRETFGPRKLLAYHSSRLLPHEADAIRALGLRCLDEHLVRDRISDAVAHGALPDAARHHAETANVYAINNAQGRVGQSASSSGAQHSTRTPAGATRFCATGAARPFAAAPMTCPRWQQ